MQPENEFPALRISVDAAHGGQDGHMPLGMRTVVHQHLRHLAVARADLPGEEHQIGKIVVEHPRLDHDARPGIGDVEDGFPKVPHAPRQPVQRNPQGQQHAKDAEQQRRGQHLINIDATSTQRHQLPVRAHA